MSCNVKVQIIYIGTYIITTSNKTSYRRAAYQLFTYCSLWLDRMNQRTALPQTESSVKIFL